MKVRENWSNKASQGKLYHHGNSNMQEFPRTSQDENSVLGNIWNWETGQQTLRIQWLWGDRDWMKTRGRSKGKCVRHWPRASTADHIYCNIMDKSYPNPTTSTGVLLNLGSDTISTAMRLLMPIGCSCFNVRQASNFPNGIIWLSLAVPSKCRHEYLPGLE